MFSLVLATLPKLNENSVFYLALVNVAAIGENSLFSLLLPIVSKLNENSVFFLGLVHSLKLIKRMCFP